MNITEQIVPQSLRSKVTYKGTNGRKSITIHETANTNKGANAQAHANLQSRGNARQASWHWQVDDRGAIQSFPHTAQCWHAGDGRGNGNLNSIAIEICVNSDGDYGAAVRNAAALTRKIMAEEGIPASEVYQHNRWSGKNCPTRLRSGAYGYSWNDFLALVRGTTPNPTPTPKPNLNPFGRALLVVDGSLGPRTITEWQLQMGTPADGKFSRPSTLIRAVQGLLNRRGAKDWQGKALVVDGLGIGSNMSARYPRLGRTRTIWALQSFLGTTRDGSLSRRKSTAVMALQRALNNGTFNR